MNALAKLPLGGGNILLNGDFRPGRLINQRGQASYPSTGYCIDAWTAVGTAGSVTPGADGLVIASPQGAQLGIRQWIENIQDLKGKPLTISPKVGGIVRAFTGTVPSGAFASGLTPIVNANLGNGCTVQLYASGGASEMLFAGAVADAGASITVGYIKLEEGILATPLVREDPAIALTRCHRYLYVYERKNGSPLIGSGYMYSAYQGIIKFKVPDVMRDITPAITFPSLANLEIECSGTRTPVTAIGFSGERAIGGLNLRFDIASTFSFSKMPCSMQMYPGVAGEQIIVSAEL